MNGRSIVHGTASSDPAGSIRSCNSGVGGGSGVGALVGQGARSPRVFSSALTITRIMDHRTRHQPASSSRIKFGMQPSAMCPKLSRARGRIQRKLIERKPVGTRKPFPCVPRNRGHRVVSRQSSLKRQQAAIASRYGKWRRRSSRAELGVGWKCRKRLATALLHAATTRIC